VTKTLADRAEEMFLRILSAGDFFGERALETYVDFSSRMPAITCSWTQGIFTAQRKCTARYQLVVCLSNAQRWYCIETAGRNKWIFGILRCVIRRFRYLQK